MPTLMVQYTYGTVKQTSNFSKAHVTRDSSGSAILAISVGLQQ